MMINGTTLSKQEEMALQAIENGGYIRTCNNGGDKKGVYDVNGSRLRIGNTHIDSMIGTFVSLITLTSSGRFFHNDIVAEKEAIEQAKVQSFDLDKHMQVGNLIALAQEEGGSVSSESTGNPWTPSTDRDTTTIVIQFEDKFYEAVYDWQYFTIDIKECEYEVYNS